MVLCHLVFPGWTPELGSVCSSHLVKERWIRICGLPFHLWTYNIFVELGKGCGGCSAIDPMSLDFSECCWVRLKLCPCDLGRIPRALTVRDCAKSYRVLVEVEEEVPVGFVSSSKQITPTLSGGFGKSQAVSDFEIPVDVSCMDAFSNFESSKSGLELVPEDDVSPLSDYHDMALEDNLTLSNEPNIGQRELGIQDLPKRPRAFLRLSPLGWTIDRGR